ncbi:MAG: S8 family serine peptidase, partial [Deltaproteobacteria bacterium]|nr:S8 family serine peptidase [Deltaproteobacteria bacterium]
MKIKSLVTILVIILIQITSYAYAGELSLGLSERLPYANPKEYLSVIVRMADQADLNTATQGIMGRSKALRSRNVIRSLQATATERQQDLITFLEKEKSLGNVVHYTSFWIFNGLSLKATPQVIKKIASRDDVDNVSEDLPIASPVLLPSVLLQTDFPYTWNIEMIKAPEVWELGIDGSGVVVGIFDLGVAVNHPDLKSNYRGGDNSWFDPFGEHDQPYDYEGHGTHVTGIIVGGNAGGKYIGVAPGAKWIAARYRNDAGAGGRTSDMHKGFQWFMDPDGDPDTNDAPDVVNNSWSFLLSPYCRRGLQDDIRALRMAGIIPVFSAGNSGPLPFFANSPGNYPETIAVGATGPFDIIYFFSSRGPNNCDLSIFPDITAPGIGILSSTPHGNYLSLSGTSMAAPHVTGIIALMLDANPNLSMDDIETTLKETSTPLGFFHPNNTYGWGR